MPRRSQETGETSSRKKRGCHTTCHNLGVRRKQTQDPDGAAWVQSLALSRHAAARDVGCTWRRRHGSPPRSSREWRPRCLGDVGSPCSYGTLFLHLRPTGPGRAPSSSQDNRHPLQGCFWTVIERPIHPLFQQILIEHLLCAAHVGGWVVNETDKNLSSELII